MNNVIFPIPGLMPPKAPNWMSKLISPEDGSLCLLLHAGAISDDVTYAIDVRGWRPGVIKDPDYDYAGGYDFSMRELPRQALVKTLDRSKWPDFLRTSSELPENILIPRKVYCGCPIPINELPCLDDLETVWYWILELPERALPMGDTVVEACINGKVRKYVVQRPAYRVHSKSALTYCYQAYTPVFDTNDVLITSNASGQVAVSFPLQPVVDKFNKVDQTARQFRFSVIGDTTVQTTDSTIDDNDMVTLAVRVPTPVKYTGFTVEVRFNERDNAWLPVVESITQ